jgi:hypothetical protein
MSRLIWMLLIIASLLFVVGSEVDTDALAKQSINEANSLADALEAGKGDSEIEAISSRLGAINTTIDRLSQRQIKNMRKKHGHKYDEAMRRICKLIHEMGRPLPVPLDTI